MPPKTTTFYLTRADSDKDTAIYLFHTCSDGRLKYFIGESIIPHNWTSGNIPKATAAVMSRVSLAIDSLTSDYKIKGDRLTKAKLKAHLVSVQKLHRTEKKPDNSNQPAHNIFSEMDLVIEKMKAGKIQTPANKRYSKGTLKAISFTRNLLERFKPSMRQAEVDMHLYNEFIVWCQGLDYAMNYIGNQIKNWKTLGKHVGGNDIYASRLFKITREETFDIYLDETELKKIFQLQLTSREDLVRDWYILDSYTGLRVSDLVLLKKRNIDGGMITIANEKTDEKVMIPVHPYVQAILAKYKGFPPTITDVEINRIIKKVALKAGIKGRVLFTITKGGSRKDEYLQKWEMVSCHTARRSFITNLRKNGVPDTIVMKLTGIKSFETLRKYDKISHKEAADIAADHPFFN